MARLGGTRVAAGVAVLLAALACTASPVQPTPSTRPTPEATPAPTPDINAPFPTTVLGLPVLTVDTASRLLVDGRLDGRVAAVSGYWMEGMPMGCPYVPHQPMLEDRCLLRTFTDEHIQPASYSEGPDGSTTYTWAGGHQGPGLLIPLSVPETVGDDLLGSGPITPENDNPAQRVVVVGHAADARLSQCAPAERQRCADFLVLDRVVWIDGMTVPLTVPYSEAGAAMTLDAALAAANVAPDQALTAYPVLAGAIGEIDPRLVGVGGDVVWVVRSIAEAVDADGTASATNVALSDDTAGILRTVPLGVADDNAAARLVVSVAGPQLGGESGYASYSVLGAAGFLVSDSLGDMPVVLAPGAYTLHGFIKGARTSPPPTASCDTHIQLTASEDVYMLVEWASDGTCGWSVDQPWP